MTPIVLVALLGGCGGGCESPLTPLPAAVPKDQVVEGAVQVRVSSRGLLSINEYAGEIIKAVLGDGVCAPRISQSFTILSRPASVRACEERTQCGGGAQGCLVRATVGTTTLSAPDESTLRLKATGVKGSASTTVRGTVDMPWPIPDWNPSCAVSLKLHNLDLETDVSFGVREDNGSLAVALKDIKALNINVQLDGCLVAELAGAVIDGLEVLLNTRIGLAIANLVRPYISDLIVGMLPNPIGVEGVLDLGQLLGGLIPGIESKLEVSAFPGGYAKTPNEGISVGLVVGLNTDRDTSTRDLTTDTEPSRCVPAWSAPDLTGRLDKHPTRGTFSLPPAGGFLGEENFGTDVALGISETVLDQGGFHVLASGALCAAVDSSFAPQLNLGTVGILVPSLAKLGTGKEPVLLQLRPTKPIDFDIGDGGDTPYLSAKLDGLEVDFYAYLFERYVRAFTISISAEIGVNLEFMINDEGDPVLIPTLVGLQADKITVDISNAEFLKETPEQLEAVFPTILNLVIPLIGGAIPEVKVPAVLGFTLGDLRLRKVETAKDDFLAIMASLARAPTIIFNNKVATAPVRVTTSARLVGVENPTPDQIHTAVVRRGAAGGALPEVELELGGRDAEGRALEWQWRLDQGMWRPFAADPVLVVRDPSLALQGKHVVEVRARAIGDYQSTSLETVTIPVTIDSLAPRVLTEQARLHGDQALIPAVDAVHDDTELAYALGRASDDQPRTEWSLSDGWFDRGQLARVADDQRVRVFARDPLGNIGSAVVDLTTLGVEPGGCSVAPGAGGGGGLLVVLLGLAFALRRRAAVLLALVCALGACSKASLGEVECEIDEDCASKCPDGEVGLCFDGFCSCEDDLPLGDVGTWSDLAVSSSGEVWVSAYNQRHGDLMVASAGGPGRVADERWQFVDGVPDGPVVLADSDVRGGIAAPGDDVGMYSSIAVGPQGPLVAYYDRTHASLKLALSSGGVWRSVTVDAGVVAAAPPARDVGRYASLTLDAEGRPGIAYLAVVEESATVKRSEVRFARATTAQPATGSDWDVVTIDSAPLPEETPADLALDDAPRLNGLFITSARKTDGSPVVAYYDRVNGALRVVQAAGATGAFAAPVTVDRDGGDLGWSPALAITPANGVAVAYVDLTRGALMYQTVPGTAEVVDDGFRTDGMTGDGTPRPVRHRIGDDAGLIVTSAGVVVAYQDATSHELLVATGTASTWTREPVAGFEEPFAGAYGFHAAAETHAGELYLSSYVLDLGQADAWVEIFKQPMP